MLFGTKVNRGTVRKPRSLEKQNGQLLNDFLEPTSSENRV